MEASLQQYLSEVTLDMFDSTDIVNIIGSVSSPDVTIEHFPRRAAKWLMKRNQHVIETSLANLLEQNMVPHIGKLFQMRIDNLTLAGKYFYVFKLTSNIYKIGMTGDVKNRLSTLQTAREENILEIGSVYSTNVNIKHVEFEWKRLLSKFGLTTNGGTEIFDFSQFTDEYYKGRGITPDTIVANIIRLTQEKMCQLNLISIIAFEELVGCQPKPTVDKGLQVKAIEILKATLKRKTTENANLKRKNTKLMKLDGQNMMGQSGNRFADNNVQQWREQMGQPVETATRRQRNAATSAIAKRLRQNKAFYEKYRDGSWYNVSKLYKDIGIPTSTRTSWCRDNNNLTRRRDINDWEGDNEIHMNTYLANIADFAMVICNLAPKYKQPGSVLMTQLQLTTKDMQTPDLFVAAFVRVHHNQKTGLNIDEPTAIDNERHGTSE